MKRLFYASTVLALTSILNCGCKKEPKACFNMSSRYFANPGQSTNFTNCSEEFTRSEWNFGDGGTSTVQEPSHQWENKGIYDVKLTVFTKSKNAKTSQKVYVGQKGYVNCKIKILAWKDTSGSNFAGFGFAVRSFRASNNTATGANYFSSPRQYAAGFSSDQGTININEDSNLNVELSVSGGAGGKIVIPDVNIIDGVPNTTGTANLPVCDFNYTLTAYIAP